MPPSTPVTQARWPDSGPTPWAVRSRTERPPRTQSCLRTDDPAAGPRLAFHQVPEPKTVKNRFHLDLITTDYQAEIRRLVGLGATVLNAIDNGARWTTMADPEGNEFDLIQG